MLRTMVFSYLSRGRCVAAAVAVLLHTQPTLGADDNLSPRGGGSGSASRFLQSDGVCSNYGTTGYHNGNYMETLEPGDSPNGIAWTWEQCAAECCARTSAVCSFWTLQLNGERRCFMMTGQTTYSDTGGHIEGDRDEDCCSTEPPPPALGAWRFVWSDEFDGADGDPLDSTVWGYETGYVRNNEAQYYSTSLSNSRIDDGHALIEARREPAPNGQDYTSASRITRGKKSFLYGRFSLRARIDVRPGSWPAWWWLPETGGWPIGGEIDMMEYYQNKVLFNVMDGWQTWTSVQPSLDQFPGGGAEWSKNFHTWTFDWSLDKIRLYLDGVLMNDYDVSNADGTGPDGENPFRRPAYFLMNQAIWGTAGGDPSSTDFPVRYRVDWIRQWEWDPNVAVENGTTVQVVDGAGDIHGAGSGRYEVGTNATAAVGQPPVGEVFDSWTIVSGNVVLDDYLSETTTFTVPSDGGDVILRADFVPGNPPTDSPVAAPTPPPIDPPDGVCSKYTTEGWHKGVYKHVMEAGQAPDGSGWEWEECARACALSESLYEKVCEFWTLQLGIGGRCHLMSNQGDYVASSNHAEGDKDLDCAGSTGSPSVSPTRSPTVSPTRSPTYQPTNSPTDAPTGSGYCNDGSGRCADESDCGCFRRRELLKGAADEEKQKKRQNVRRLPKKTPGPTSVTPNPPSSAPTKEPTFAPTPPVECTCSATSPAPTNNPTPMPVVSVKYLCNRNFQSKEEVCANGISVVGSSQCSADDGGDNNGTAGCGGPKKCYVYSCP